MVSLVSISPLQVKPLAFKSAFCSAVAFIKSISPGHPLDNNVSDTVLIFNSVKPPSEVTIAIAFFDTPSVVSKVPAFISAADKLTTGGAFGR